MTTTHDELNQYHRQVVLVGGDRLDAFEETTQGVMTDAGIVAWSEVVGFRSWHSATERWMFIPA